MSLTKTSDPKLSIFVVEARRLFKSFEGLNSSLAQSAGELLHLAEIPEYTFCGILFFTKNLFFDP